jgi:hypothetical protein
MLFLNELGSEGGVDEVGRKVLLTMFARQFFPSALAKETFR